MTLGLHIAAKTVLKKDQRFDIYPLVTGVTLSLFLPASAPLWLPVIASVLMTVIAFIPTKKASLTLSPIPIALIFVFLLFPGIMNAIPEEGYKLHPFAMTLKTFRAIPASPLEKVLTGYLPDTTTFETFFGLNSARIGEISGFLIILVFIYLALRRTVKVTLPLTYILTVGAFAYLNPSLQAASDFIAFDGALYNVFGSNTFLVAAFLLSNPARAPKTTLGALICGVAGGLITMLLRGHVMLGITAPIAVVIIDLALPLVDKFIKPTPFGGNIAPQKEENKNEQ
jgi:electron transport complex protein RnfD